MLAGAIRRSSPVTSCLRPALETATFRNPTIWSTLDGLYAKLMRPATAEVSGGMRTRYLGKPFVYPDGTGIGSTISRGVEWDWILRDIVRELLPQESPVVCEVGSNIGASVLQILKARPRARVVCFEPSKRFLPYLEENLRLAGYRDVEVRNLLVGPSRGNHWLYNDATSGSVRDWSHYSERQLVEMTTLDHFWIDRSPIDFLKVDTDGYDFEVLRGGQELLARDHPLIFFELSPHLMQDDPVEGFRWLQSLGYETFCAFAPAGGLLEITLEPSAVIGHAETASHCDVLACQAGLDVASRLKQIRGRAVA
ncbi:MAG: FkbM family methyltransferase [Dehalococcoidia bacterium]|nr:FkbM family methyltransferase [Dehalococcoidia bacterium]